MKKQREANHPAGFKFYPNDWLSSPKVAMMTAAEEGTYIRLLCYCWADKDFSIPDDDALLAKLSKLDEGTFKASSSCLRACFIPHPTLPGRLTNERLLKERKKQEIWLEQCSAGGVKSGKQRRKHSEGTLKVPSRELEGTSHLSLSLPLPIKNTPTPLVLTPEELAEKFNAIPGVKPVKFIDGKIPDTIREQARRRIKDHNTIEFWDTFLKLISDSAFLTGKVCGRNGEKPFRASFVWIMGPKNFDKILAGTYTEHGASANDSAKSLRLDGTGRFSITPDGTKKRILVT